MSPARRILHAFAPGEPCESTSKDGRRRDIQLVVRTPFRWGAVAITTLVLAGTVGCGADVNQDPGGGVGGAAAGSGGAAGGGGIAGGGGGGARRGGGGGGGGGGARRGGGGGGAPGATGGAGGGATQDASASPTD